MIWKFERMFSTARKIYKLIQSFVWDDLVAKLKIFLFFNIIQFSQDT